MNVFRLYLKNLSLLFYLFICLSLCYFIFSADAAVFNTQEKFEYDLTWTGLKAGTATLEITDAGNHMKIISTAKSAKWVSVFYEVDDRVETILAKSPSPGIIGQPVNYRLKVKEGRHKRDKEVIFKNAVRKVTYIDHINNERLDFDVPLSIFDPLSSFFHIRTLELIVGRSVYVTIFDSKKVWDVEVQVLKKEKVIFEKGAVNTILIKPLMKSEGIFYKKGEILIWLTDDEKRLPVKMQTKVAIGAVTATLAGGKY